ncbi:serine/threonine-protein phosphatase 4 regulatory subunit 4-like isoform X2 [Biomphalaria glabrata]|uniref:Serine/threonine-protein phosphatase 4 regulatory subunit 4-like isoform X2 n=1 Tax=Biomphalaria glabrata TaxID=6526 RepID=A0A9W2ZYM5_BIOGL|nr:serine/threonine-protein phosphatase 4 regulatory subunit 4-like isoform X2 [Biomphalaria glabrata]
MGDRSLAQSTPATMRGGVLEPLEPVDRDNCMPLQAVIVRNGKIFVDSIDSLDHGVNDENRRLDAEVVDGGLDDDDVCENHGPSAEVNGSIGGREEGISDENRRMEEEIDRLTGGNDDDDDIDSCKFSQEAFDSFMSASEENEDELGDIMIYNQLANGKETGIGGSISVRQAYQRRGQQNHIHQFEQYDYHPHQHYHDNHDAEATSGPFYNGGFSFHEEGNSSVADLHSIYLRHGPPVHLMYDVRNISTYETNGHELGESVDPSARNSKAACRRRDSLNLEEYSTFDEDVERLLSEDLDCSWRYVPLYPETYYSSGQEVQRVSVITELPNLLRDNTVECMRRVVPKVREVLHVANIDMQLAAATAFLQILERQLVSVEDYKKTFLQTILTSVDNKNEEVANAWLETLLTCIDLLPKDVVKKDVLSIAVNKGQLSQTLQARLSCCKILGKVSSKFENFVVKNDVLPVVLSLCGDVEYDVRACMCQKLDVVAHGLGLELTKAKLLPQLIELSEDESPNVTCACLETTANIISMLDREANVNAIIPMVKELLEKAISKVDTTLPVASKLFGRLCHSLMDYMTVDDKAYFQEYFKKLCKVGVSEKKYKEDTQKLLEGFEMYEQTTDISVETRRYAAYNFPAMVLFVGAKLFRSELYGCFSQLSRDPHSLVRRTVAAGFHEVARLLNTNVGILFTELNSLLNDADIEILKAIIPNFQVIMSPLATLGFDQFTENRTHAVQDVVTNYLRAETTVFSCPCWRTQEAMLANLQTTHLLCSNDFVFNRVLPVLIDKLKYGRALPVRVMAAKTLTTLTRHLKYKSQRDEILDIMIEDFHKSDSCYCRSLFIDLAKCYLQVNSKQAFKDNFYELILNMKSDKVATVRLKMLSIFPDMKRSLKLPKDQNLRTALDTALRQIIVYDKDKDVQQAAQQMSEELTLIQEGSDNTRANRRNLSAEEEDDLKREDEEKEILMREEKDKKDEETKLSKSVEKRNSVGNKKELLSKIPGTKKASSSTMKLSPGSLKGENNQSLSKRALITTGTTNTLTSAKVVAALTNEKHPSVCLIKSKSTTCIPSLIPRLEHRPSTPPKKDPVRRIPVLVNSKTVPSTTSLSPSASFSKKSTSPTPVKRNQSNSSPLTPNALGASTARRGSTTAIGASVVSARRGSVGSASSTASDQSVKVKAGTTPTKPVTMATRLTKKSTK